jgi:hypothetical protein
MNKIYYAVVDEDYGGVYISAKSIKEAKALSLSEDIISENMESYIDLKCHAVRDRNKKIHTTELPSKILSIQEIIKEKCHWWYCKNEECEQDEYFVYSDTGEWGRYKCPKCGMMYDIPYVNS